MKLKFLEKKVEVSGDYGLGSGKIETFIFECPCGKGRIIAENDETPGFSETDVWIECTSCKEKYLVDTSKGWFNFDLIERE